MAAWTLGRGKVALVTGASSGIGRELARLLARDGHDLVLVARNVQRLEQVAEQLGTGCGIQTRVLPADLAEPTSPEVLFTELRRSSIEVDVLVNSAGFGLFGPCADSDLTAELCMMRVNMLALTHLTKLLLPGMLERGQGRILNLASTAAFQPGPLMAVYYATQSYVLSFSEALARELRGSGVTVTALCPGPTRTDFVAKAGTGRTRIFRNAMMEVETVARAGYHGMMRGQTVVVPGMLNKTLAQLVRIGPRGLVAAIVEWLHQE
jgi:short-subunit dehydrogenase